MIKIEIEISRGLTTKVTRRNETYSVSNFEYTIKTTKMPVVLTGNGSWGKMALKIISDVGNILSQYSLFEDPPNLLGDQEG